jgi:glutamate synthase (NADPH/NADH) large chain
LSGAKVIVYPPRGARYKAADNIIIGNVAFYGATQGQAFINGIAGERFCVRNSGVKAIVEGIGDHGCEYMTGGEVIVLGETGRNFAAGMSGGVAYVYDIDGHFEKRLNKDMVNLYRLIESSDADLAHVKSAIEKHVACTGSERGAWLLANWDAELPKFFKVMPRDYERMLECFKKVEQQGLSGDEAAMAAFEENLKDLSRIGGN